MTTPPLRVWLWGTPALAVPSLHALHADPRIHLVGVTTPPPAPRGRGQRLTPCPLHTAAESLGHTVTHARTATQVDTLCQQHAAQVDVGVVIAFGVLFRQAALSTWPLGQVNVHFSLLPQWRGASPVQSAILSGQSESGITLQRMVKALDAGPILWQHRTDITQQRTSALWPAWGEVTATHLVSVLLDYQQGEITPTPQDSTLATTCGKFTKADGYADPRTMTATTIERMTRAFDVWPTTSVLTPLGRVRLHDVSLPPAPDTVPLPCAQGTTLFVHTLQLPSRPRAHAQAVLRNHPDLFAHFSA